jgi:hypothetical protein
MFPDVVSLWSKMQHWPRKEMLLLPETNPLPDHMRFWKSSLPLCPRGVETARLCMANVMCKRDISSVASHRGMINLSKRYITCALELPMRTVGLDAKQIILIRQTLLE